MEAGQCLRVRGLQMGWEGGGAGREGQGRVRVVLYDGVCWICGRGLGPRRPIGPPRAGEEKEVYSGADGLVVPGS